MEAVDADRVVEVQVQRGQEVGGVVDPDPQILPVLFTTKAMPTQGHCYRHNRLTGLWDSASPVLGSSIISILIQSPLRVTVVDSRTRQQISCRGGGGGGGSLPGDNLDGGEFRKGDNSPPPGVLKLAVVSWWALEGSSYFLLGLSKSWATRHPNAFQSHNHRTLQTNTSLSLPSARYTSAHV